MSRNSLIGLLALFLSASTSFSLPLAHYHLSQKQAQASIWLYQFANQLNLTQLAPANVRQFAALGSIPAQLHLALTLVQQGKLQGAQLYWQHALANTSDYHKQWFALIEALAQKQRWASIEKLSEHLPLSHDIEQGMHYHTGKPVANQEFAHENGFRVEVPAPSKQCQFNVLTIANSAHAVNYLHTLTKRYSLKPEPAQNLLCFSAPVYIGEQGRCTVNAQGFAQCNWDWVANHFEQAVEYDFAIAVAEKGLANVQAGVMHISTSAPYHVFLHELMHFAGFVDEYPGPKAQQAICDSSGKHYVNLVVADRAPANWQPSAYCDNGAGFKPSLNTSIMEHSHLGLSQQYRRLWRQQLQQKGHELLKLRDFLVHYVANTARCSEHNQPLCTKARAQSGKAIAE